MAGQVDPQGLTGSGVHYRIVYDGKHLGVGIPRKSRADTHGMAQHYRDLYERDRHLGLAGNRPVGVVRVIPKAEPGPKAVR